jgi:putative phosphoribosyl transferase
MHSSLERLVSIPVNDVHIEGMLVLPPKAQGLVLFAHGSGSSRHSPRNNFVARELHAQHLGTLLLDLLTVSEDLNYQTRFDIALLTHRLILATRWALLDPATKQLPLGYFGASTGAAAALQAAAAVGEQIHAVVSRGGRPDLAGHHDLAHVQAPTLLLVGGHDAEVLALNRDAFDQMKCVKELSIIPGATHLFEEPGTLEEVARQAAAWFRHHLRGL